MIPACALTRAAEAVADLTGSADWAALYRAAAVMLEAVVDDDQALDELVDEARRRRAPAERVA